MSEQGQDKSVDAVRLCDECRASQLPLPIDRPRVTYRPFTDEDRTKAAADVERWEREGLLAPADEEAGR